MNIINSCSSKLTATSNLQSLKCNLQGPLSLSLTFLSPFLFFQRHDKKREDDLVFKLPFHASSRLNISQQNIRILFIWMDGWIAVRSSYVLIILLCSHFWVSCVNLCVCVCVGICLCLLCLCMNSLHSVKSHTVEMERQGWQIKLTTSSHTCQAFFVRWVDCEEITLGERTHNSPHNQAD